MNDWLVYLVRCSDDSIYCGATNNVENRVAVHNKGKGAKYTKTRRPVVLLETSRLMAKGDALKLEHQVKKQKKDNKVKFLRTHK